MRRVLWVFLVVSLSFSASLGAEEIKALVRVSGFSPSQKAIFSQGYDVARVTPKGFEMVLTPSEIQNFRKLGFKIVTIIADLDKYVAHVAKSQKEGAAYYTYDTMTKQLQDWAAKYDKIARLKSIGKSCEDRDIWAMKVSNNPDVDQKKPAALIMGAHHSREWISIEVPMESLKQYLEGYGNNEKITHLGFLPLFYPDDANGVLRRGLATPPAGIVCDHAYFFGDAFGDADPRRHHRAADRPGRGRLPAVCAGQLVRFQRLRVWPQDLCARSRTGRCRFLLGPTEPSGGGRIVE